MANMENKLPEFLIEDLDGYRGFGITKFPLVFNEVNNKVIGSYCNDKAEYALLTEIGSTKEEVIDKLFKRLKIYGYVE